MTANSGSIQVLTGPMFSGKTEELIRRILEARAQGLNVQVFYPGVDTRPRDDPSVPQIQSHGGMSVEATRVDASSDILCLLHDDTSVIAIDEAQFFDRDLLRICDFLADQGKLVIVAGLDRDFRGEPFQTVADLITRLNVDRLRARCAVCDSPADFTQRVIDGQPAPFDSPLIMVGGSELYEPRCRRCYDVPGRPDDLDGVRDEAGSDVFEDLPGAVDVRTQLDRWAEQLEATASTGLHFLRYDRDPQREYDRQRYRDLLSLAREIGDFAHRNARLGATQGRDRTADRHTLIGADQPGYITPKVTVCGAVFSSDDEVLLVRRKGSNYWDLPGGWCDVGFPAADNAVREVWQETGLRTVPVCLVGIYDSQRWRVPSPAHLYTVVFHCQYRGGELRPDTVEVDEAAFFAESQLPLLYPGVKVSIRHAFAVHRGIQSKSKMGAYFDFIDRRTKQRGRRRNGSAEEPEKNGPA